MAVKIRLMRVGKTKQPTYRVVVADSRSPRDGRIIETIGRYQPRQDPSFVEIDAEAALGWLRKGAQASDTVQKILAIEGIWQTFESERGAPVNTKAVRRTREMARAGIKPRGPKNPVEEAPATEAAAPAAAPEASADAPAEETPAEETTTDEAAGETAAEENE